MRIFWVFAFLLSIANAQAATETAADRRIELERQEELKPTELKTPPLEAKAPPGVNAPPDAKQKLHDLQLSFLRTLPPRKVVLRHDLGQIIGILGGQTNAGTEERIRWMNERGLIPPELRNNFDPMQPLTKGVAAYTFCRLMKVKGGLIIRTFGLSQRYAFKELADMRMMQGSPHESMSGEELLILVIKATEYMARQKAEQ